ncbi:MAG: UvrB/UvrC motif-containing protein, partial [Ruminococcus sp.]
QVIMYADEVTGSMERAITETERRRKKQMDFNKEHGIIPQTIRKDIRDVIDIRTKDEVEKTVSSKPKMTSKEKRELIEELTAQMKEAAKLLEFEHAAYLRDKIKELEGKKSK